jgi:hypothetical protein
MNSWPIFLSLILKDPASGAAEGYLVNRHYPDRQIAETRCGVVEKSHQRRFRTLRLFDIA